MNQIRQVLSKTSLTLIDCTLRDGGYQNNHSFTERQIDILLKIISSSGVDFIEIGYFRRRNYDPKTPIIGRCPIQFLQSLPSLALGGYLVMIPPDNVEVDDLDELAGTKVSGVRFTCNEVNVDIVSELGKKCKTLGLKTCVNITRISELNKNRTIKIIENLYSLKPDAIYVADSNGALFPDQVAAIISEIRLHYDGPLGFHAHDSLHLAIANSLAAIKAGATWIDGTIGGIGKGGGNAPIEVLLAQVAQTEKRSIDIHSFAKALPYFDQDFFPSRFKTKLDNVLYGINNLNLEAIKNIEHFPVN